MGFFKKIRTTAVKAVRALTRRASTVLGSLRKSSSPLADRLLSDALRIAEIPSPTAREEQRAAFVLERLRSLGLNPQVDEDGNVLARITCPVPDDPRPILVLAELSSPRWHPLESLSRLDADRAYGAGLSDSLGPATLLSLAESLQSGTPAIPKDVLLLFAARPLDDPRGSVLRRLAEDPQDRPAASLSLRGLSLGTVPTKSLGTYRIEVRVRTDAEVSETDRGPRTAVDAVVALARTLTGITWDAEKRTTCAIRRIEAGSGFGHEPTEGLLDIELESADEAVLEIAMKAATATAESRGREANLQTQVTIAGYVPVGDPGAGAGLSKLVIQALKEQHIKVREESGADPAAFFSSRGIPAVSLAVASGREGLDRDEIEVASIEKGRRLLVSVIERVSKEVL
ncbi:MAG TPA: hypothetical protein P5117_06220 [Spirochaetia bacterium]|nr:hypothetical protein [Spirochaetales bacterium]HRY79680.1 hypothetical protein [Spirochaetia bacterium]HRZ89065.1 hypothetical protein [Spirochaetia bacterium]